MSFVTRTIILIGACAVVTAATSGCSGAAKSAAPADPTSGAASPSASTDACANPQVSSATSPVSQLALTVSALPPGGPPLEQISDGEMNNTVNSDQRGFANVGNTYRIEDDVVLDPSAVTATADYPQLRDAAQKQFTSLTSTSAPVHVGCEADEFIGKTVTGYSQVGVAFQEGDVIAVVLVVNSAAPVNPVFAKAVALAQDQRIVGATA
jgi:hypothetical protein